MLLLPYDTGEGSVRFVGRAIQKNSSFERSGILASVSSESRTTVPITAVPLSLDGAPRYSGFAFATYVISFKVT